ncbi:MAG: alanine--glyoxylate aminotransferase family protein [Verrucomicrobia bacterium]|nr:MAG: alanine--glyoxylate aminotransferase family protein [Verrucomicrobiota bacterium]
MSNQPKPYKLFIPGPIQVSEKTFRAMTAPMIGHRSPDFVELYKSVQPGLQALFETKDPVFISTSSAWGVMEGSVRNLTKKKVLNCMNGAFSDKWNDVSTRIGKPTGTLRFEWGQPVDPEAVRRELSTGEYDTITFIHNETSTGTMSPIAEIMAVVREFPEVISVVDAVSSFSAVRIPKDELGIDVLLTGSQKALALPPGLSLISVSQRAIERAKTVEGRGYYFDFLEFLKNHEKGMTPSTPAIPLIRALKSKLEDIEAEGIENRFARHKRLNTRVREWGAANGFELFPAPEFGSISLNCFKNTRNIDLPALNQRLKEAHGCVIDGGYGKLKGQTFRISNMGDETDETIDTLLAALDSVLKELNA